MENKERCLKTPPVSESQLQNLPDVRCEWNGQIKNVQTAFQTKPIASKIQILRTFQRECSFPRRPYRASQKSALERSSD